MNPATEVESVPTVAEEQEEGLPPLEAGDRLDQKTFHARYEAMPEHVRAELIRGRVHMPSPLKRRHGRMGPRLIAWLTEYEDGTPGVETYDNTTAILGEESEPMPDAYLLIAPECGGQTRVTEDDYVEGVPEFIGELASSSESIDLHDKRDDYEQAGVKEYLVVALRQRRVYWFILRDSHYQELQPGPDGILRSEVFPGLWLDPAALLRRDAKRIKEVLQQGLASPEHAAFVTQLAQRRKPSQP
jgi:Uma2 family endonuclease